MKTRDQVFVVGEGLTEKYYFQHLKKLKKYSCQIRPRLFSKQNSIAHIEKKTRELLQGDVIVICVFDTDVTAREPKEKEILLRFFKKYKNNKNVIICDSLPSIEFWFLLHFKLTNKHFENYKSIRNELRKFLPEYDKKEKYLKQEEWVKILISKQDEAVKHSKTLSLGNGSYSHAYRAIELLESKQ